MSLHPVFESVTERIRERSATSRAAYLARIAEVPPKGVARSCISCTNLAHGFAAFGENDKAALRGTEVPNVAIVSAYNDMLSAHQPYVRFPEIIKDAAREAGGVAQFAGGVPAMCDGVTQGQVGMELSLFSRDVIALATAVALSHNMFDAALCLGICDKIVPGLLIGVLSFGHLPVIFVPGGPMPTGLPHREKNRIRELYTAGKIGRDELLEAEAASYHSPGTCTFYGTANSNQMMMEVMGLHMPGAAFINPNTPLRDALTAAAAKRALEITALGDSYTPVGKVVDERAIANAVVGLLATGGSTNHTLHLVAIARVAGIRMTWDDFSELSAVTPTLAKVYPSGKADVNGFHAAGGMGFVTRELLAAGLLHGDKLTVAGGGMERYCEEPYLEGDALRWRPAPEESRNDTILRKQDQPFSPNGGLRLLTGNLGRAMIKISAVAPEHRVVEAPAIVFDSQDEVLEAFYADRLRRDFVAIVRYQGPRANGMPELHKLTPSLSVLQDEGFKVALVTDGRMSGASGKVPAAIHVTPECLAGGPLAKVRTGDVILLDAERGILDVRLGEEELTGRPPATVDMNANRFYFGRELFNGFRDRATGAEEGAMSFMLPEEAAPAAPARKPGLGDRFAFSGVEGR
ncbi:MAG TPA: phosphogluconate dehydratase [Rhodospirillales bacterium]|nr:phosphogluconate dehydratase [Rhodospirillales bacterium]